MTTPTPKDPLGSAWMIVAALGFTVMNVCIKAAAAKFSFNSGELVFWRMSFAAVALGIMAKARGDTFATPHWKTHLNRSVVGTAAMFCLFYAVMHLPLATGVTLSYTSSIFLAVFSFFYPERADRVLYAGDFVIWLFRCRPAAEPFVQRRTGNRRIGRLGGRSHVRLGVFAGARTVVARRAGLAGSVLFFDNRCRHGIGLGNFDRLAQHSSIRPALSFLHRTCRHACPAFHDPRL